MQEKSHNEQEYFFFESVNELQRITKEIERLGLLKDMLTRDIISCLSHEHGGQKTYEYAGGKMEVKAPCVYSLDKKKYESGEFVLPDNFNPVKESVSYSIDKRLCEKYMQEAPQEVRDILIELIEKKPGKASISFKEQVL